MLKADLKPYLLGGMVGAVVGAVASYLYSQRNRSSERRAEVSAFSKQTGLRPGIYRHFKGNLYEVIEVASHSEMPKDTPEALHVVYRCLYADRRLCVRPLAMFTETVTREGKTQPRFAYVGEDETTVRKPILVKGRGSDVSADTRGHSLIQILYSL
eukprot:g29544.t1